MPEKWQSMAQSLPSVAVRYNENRPPSPTGEPSSAAGTNMKTISIDVGDHRLNITVREAEDPATWELQWSGYLEPRYARRMLKAAETMVLRNGGDRMALVCGADQDALRADLQRWPTALAPREGERYTLQLVAPADDGLVHDDDDFRTPLPKITCPTCVHRIAQSRIRRREEAMATTPGPQEIAKHSRLIAEAYTRLAEIEETLVVRRADSTG